MEECDGVVWLLSCVRREECHFSASAALVENVFFNPLSFLWLIAMASMMLGSCLE